MLTWVTSDGLTGAKTSRSASAVLSEERVVLSVVITLKRTPAMNPRPSNQRARRSRKPAIENLDERNQLGN